MFLKTEKLNLRSGDGVAQKVEVIVRFLDDFQILLIPRQMRHDLLDVEVENVLDFLELIAGVHDDRLSVRNQILDEIADL